jgi:5-methylcytosine-specific restriction protein A
VPRLERVAPSLTVNYVPQRPAHGCAEPGCPTLVRGRARCVEHDRALRSEIDSMRPSAARRGYGHRWRQIRLDHLRHNPLCVECLRDGRSIAATDVDHVVARARGGTDAPTNLQSLCHTHHSSKTAREDGRFGPRGAAR